MSTPSALRIVSAPISNLKPRDLILSKAGVVPLGFVAQGDGTVIVKWSSPLDPDNPNESLPVVNGAQYTCQIDTIISSDVDLLLFFGDNAAGAVHLGGGLSSGGGGGGDASAANQVLALTALDSIYDALQLVGTEATSADILAAVQSLSGGASLNDLATALAPLATEATQADVLAALEAQGVDVGLIQTNVALLVPDVDAMKDSLASIDGKIPASPAQDRTTFGAPFAVRVANAGATGFVTPFVSGDTVAQSGTWNITNISGTISLPTGAATSAAQTDGSQKSVVRGGAKGSTTAADVTSTASGSNRQALDVVLYDTTGVVIGRGDTNGLIVQGPGSANAALIGKPNVIAISDGGNAQIPLGDSSGRLRVLMNRNITANGSTDAPTRFPTLGDFIASSSGVAVVKATSGRLFAFDVYYTGSTASGIWLHAHDAASATTPVTGTIKKSWPINNGTNVQIEWESFMDLCFTNGIKFTISSARLTETTATTETFSIAAWGA